MRKTECGRTVKNALFLLALAVYPVLAFASGPASPVLSSPVPSVAPGVYPSSQYVTFSVPPGSRLLVGLDGAAPSELSSPLPLSVPDGAAHTFRVETVLYPFSPESATSVRTFFSWTIDRAPPSAPRFAATRAPGGRFVSATFSEDGLISWKMYHPAYAASAEGILAQGDTLFVPDGASFCAWAVDCAGNRGPAGNPGYSFPDPASFPCRIVSPVTGIWANAQVLVIERGEGVSVSYTIDNSDPSVSGIPYIAPVLLDPAVTNVRVHAVDGNGRTFDGSVRFQVSLSSSSAAGVSPVQGLAAGGGLVETGEFMEIRMNHGFAGSPGNAVLPDDAVDQLVLTSVRGVRSFTPVTVTDGTSFWRWVFAGGNPPPAVAAPAVSSGQVIALPPGAGAPAPVVAASTAAPAMSGTTVPPAVAPTPAVAPISGAPAPSALSLQTSPSSPEAPALSIHDWYFLEIAYRSPVYYALDSGAWKEFDAPVFVDRSGDHAVRWYSATWKNGAVQNIALPAKPSLIGIPASGLTASPVFVTVPDTGWKLQYEGGAYRPSAPGSLSPELSSGLLVEVPNGTESDFSFRFLASTGGIPQGELAAQFTIDRKKPRTPDPGIPSSLVYSRVPVTLKPSGEDTIQISIKPEFFTRSGSTFILGGDPEKPVDYTVSLFSVDKAGNASRTETRKITVDINALYVNPEGEPGRNRDGTPSAPYISLDDALDAIRGPGAWRIYLLGDATLSKMHAVHNDITLYGTTAVSGGSRERVLSVGPGAGFSVSGYALGLKGCRLLCAKTADAGTSPAAPMSMDGIPSFSLANASLYLEDTTIIAGTSNSGSFLSARNSSVVMTRTKVSFQASEYAQLLSADTCELTFDDCALAVQARDSSALSLTDSRARLSRTTITVTVDAAGRAVEAWGSTLSLSGVSVVRNQGGKAGSAPAYRDTAIWVDGASRIDLQEGVTASGFARIGGSETVR